MINRGVVLSKFQLLWSVWGEDFDGSENVVELYIGYLRRKLDHDRTPLIHTRRGAGYILREERGDPGLAAAHLPGADPRGHHARLRRVPDLRRRD